ncbi:MAG: hypothetical protein K2X81_20920 [Candidatus Obscuribacterales bacterium]|nr:hypothetical protein [Candidatus Obscuribacterales bacterium]
MTKKSNKNCTEVDKPALKTSLQGTAVREEVQKRYREDSNKYRAQTERYAANSK